jgi:hypothetical protein
MRDNRGRTRGGLRSGRRGRRHRRVALIASSAIARRATAEAKPTRIDSSALPCGRRVDAAHPRLCPPDEPAIVRAGRAGSGRAAASEWGHAGDARAGRPCSLGKSNECTPKTWNRVARYSSSRPWTACRRQQSKACISVLDARAPARDRSQTVRPWLQERRSPSTSRSREQLRKRTSSLPP